METRKEVMSAASGEMAEFRKGWGGLRKSFLLALICFLAQSEPQCFAAQDEGASPDLTAMGIEDLMDLTVTSVSRGEQKVYNSAAAVFVITQEDIRRSGATSIADALRMAPGLDVARIDGNKWAISSRGFNGRFASKMLVLMDGRTVYTPLFSGVFWDAQDTLIEDIERIEIVRGPGATLWGANAVNGVINIITKHSDDTRGTLFTAGGGTLERAFGSARYGTNLGNDASARVYLKYFTRQGLDNPQTGDEEHNGWHSVRGGFRVDAEPNVRDAFTLQGDYYDQRMDETYMNLPTTYDYTTPASGGNLLGRWKRTFSDTADMALQLYYDRTEVKYSVIGEQLDTVDFDFQNRFALGSRQEVVWGAGYRYLHDRLQFPLPLLNLGGPVHDNNLYSAFVQDTVTLAPDRLFLTVGTKLEHNDFTGFELQPNVRLLWRPTDKQAVWASVSRAVRTPSRGEEGLSLFLPGPEINVSPLPGPIPTQLHLIGSTALQAENLIAYEVGYRVEPVPKVTLDAAAFYNVYHRLDIYKTGIPDITTVPPTLNMQLGNFGSAQTCGAELAADLKALPWWRFRLAYTYLQLVETKSDPGATFTDLQGVNPKHQVSLRSMTDLTKNIDLDLWLRYVDALDAFGIGDYLTLDARLAWKPTKDLEVALVGQNLLQDRHQEFMPLFISTQPAAVPRSVYGKVSWRF